MQSRRAFIGSTAAVAAATGAALFRPSLGRAQIPTASGSASDPVVEEFVREIQQASRDLTRAKGEGARRIAQTLRAWAAYGDARDYNGAFTRGANSVIAARGRQGIVYGTPNHAEIERYAKRLGLESLVDLHQPGDAALREKALDTLMNDGVTSALRLAADSLDKAGKWLDEHQINVQPVAFARSCSCDDICTGAMLLKSEMDVVCAISALFPPAADLCAAIAMSWLTMSGMCSLCRYALCW